MPHQWPILAVLVYAAKAACYVRATTVNYDGGLRHHAVLVLHPAQEQAPGRGRAAGIHAPLGPE